jgi:hypothetical protein
MFPAVLLIRSGPNADPKPWSQTNADLDHGQNLNSQKVKFFHEKYTFKMWVTKSIPTKVHKAFLTARNQVYFLISNFLFPRTGSTSMFSDNTQLVDYLIGA